MSENNISSKIEQGLKIINKGFEKNPFLNLETPFVSILIWQCLNTVNHKLVRQLVGKGVEKLMSEKSSNNSFNYWLKSSNKYKNEPYPDDLDDTFCALSVIYGYNQKYINGGDLVLITNLLIDCEKKEGGPYKTWLVNEDKENKWSDIDLAVNCNIGYFLRFQDVELDSINNLLEQAIKENKLISPYYKGIWPIIYFAARFYQGKDKLKLIKIIKENLNDKNTVMEKAIALSSLIRLGDKKNSILMTLISQISDIEECESEDFYFYIEGSKKYIGHRLLTIALVIEALNMNKQSKKSETKTKKMNTEKLDVIEDLERFSLDLSPAINKQFQQILKKIIRSKNIDIILLTPFILAKSLRKTNKIKKEFLQKLSYINTLGWMAYTIYDDLIDNDKDIKWLPLANIICRRMDMMFTQLLPECSIFLKEYLTIMNRLEESNFWEIENCRLTKERVPNFTNIKRLSDRSMGHALTSMAILHKINANEKDIYELKNFYYYFLAAKQMSDDAHDWENDLKKGQINSASAEIFKLTSERKNGNKLKLIFWEKVFDKYAERILEYCTNAKSSLMQISCLKNTKYFDKMVDKVINSTNLALSEKKKTQDFINNYYKK